MAATITYDQIENHNLKIEGTLAYISAWKTKIILAFLIKVMLLPLLRKLEQMLDLKKLDEDMAEKVLSSLKETFRKYQNGLAKLNELDLPFYICSDKDKEKLIHYSEYLEDIIEALEIGLDKEAASKIESIAKETAFSPEITPWREALEQI